MTYTDLKRNAAPGPKQQQQEQPLADRDSQQQQGQGVAIDGFLQVIEMLKVADPAFRESILARLAARDPQLAREIRKQL
jgi:hypothetical protein